MKVTKLNRYLFPAVALAVTTALTGCEGTSSTGAAPAVTKPVTASPTPTSVDEILKEIQESNEKAREELQKEIDEAAASASAEAQAGTSSVPNVVGMNHREAMDKIHGKGFMVDEEDASPEGRKIILNSGWKVCRQDPAPGATNVLRVTIYSVKLTESC